MWLVEGPFEEVGGEDAKHLKAKLLKAGTSYPLGRKAKHPGQLVVADKRISGEHVTFIVGPCSVDNIDNPSYIPSLKLQNHRSKLLPSKARNGERISIPASSEVELHSGQEVALVVGINVIVRWFPVCCLISSKSFDVSFAQCASMGVHIVSTPRKGVTHHLISEVEASATIAISLLSSVHLVQPNWIKDLLRLGEAKDSGPSELEHQFSLPDESQYRPSLSSNISPDFWTANGDRSNVLVGKRFLFLGNKGELDMEMRTLIEFGRAQYEVFDVASGLMRWKQTLLRNTRKVESEAGTRLVVVGDASTLKISVGDSWHQFINEINSTGLRIIERAQVVESVLLSDSTLLDSNAVNASSEVRTTPDAETDKVESTVPKRRVLPKRALETNGSTNAASDPVAQPSTRASAEPEGRRRPLVKRALTKANPPPILGVDDPSVDPVTESQLPPPEPQKEKSVFKPPSAGANRNRSVLLKKRVRAQDSDAGVEDSPMELEPVKEPPLKKFRALFEETDPDRIGSQISGHTSQLFSQMSTENAGSVPTSGALASVQEEEETSSEQTHGVTENTGPAALASGAQQLHTPSIDAQTGNVQSTSIGETEASSSKKAAHGAAPGNPDTDTAFLQALASTKKGKKREDDFDREFNNLRISKPEQEKEDEAANWKVLAEFEDEENILGNFMVIVEMDVPEHGLNPQRQASVASSSSRPEWQGKDNFKKFKKTSVARHRPPVELLVEEQEDYGMGPSYWKASQDQTHSQEGIQGDIALKPSQLINKDFMQPKASTFVPQSQFSKPQSRSRVPSQTQAKLEQESPKIANGNGMSKGKGRALPVVAEEDDFDDLASPALDGRSASEKTPDPLFLEEDEKEDEIIIAPTRQSQRSQRSTRRKDPDKDLDFDDLDDLDDSGAEEGTLRSMPQSTARSDTTSKSKTSPAKKGKKRPANKIVDDDSDTGMTFQGFGTRNKRAKR